MSWCRIITDIHRHVGAQSLDVGAESLDAGAESLKYQVVNHHHHDEIFLTLLPLHINRFCTYNH